MELYSPKCEATVKINQVCFVFLKTTAHHWPIAALMSCIVRIHWTFMPHSLSTHVRRIELAVPQGPIVERASTNHTCSPPPLNLLPQTGGRTRTQASHFLPGTRAREHTTPSLPWSPTTPSYGLAHSDAAVQTALPAWPSGLPVPAEPHQPRQRHPPGPPAPPGQGPLVRAQEEGRPLYVREGAPMAAAQQCLARRSNRGSQAVPDCHGQGAQEL